LTDLPAAGAGALASAAGAGADAPPKLKPVVAAGLSPPTAGAGAPKLNPAEATGLSFPVAAGAFSSAAAPPNENPPVQHLKKSHKIG
jgi:hypothetical protein